MLSWVSSVHREGPRSTEPELRSARAATSDELATPPRSRVVEHAHSVDCLLNQLRRETFPIAKTSLTNGLRSGDRRRHCVAGRGSRNRIDAHSDDRCSTCSISERRASPPSVAVGWTPANAIASPCDGRDAEGHRNALAADSAPVSLFQQPADQLRVVRADEGVPDRPPTDASDGIRAGLASESWPRPRRRYTPRRRRTPMRRRPRAVHVPPSPEGPSGTLNRIGARIPVR